MQNLLFALLLILTFFFVVTQGILFILFIRALSEFKKSHNPDEEILKRSKIKSEEIVSDAMKKANDLMTRAEKQGVDILAKEQATGTNLSDEYAKHLVSVEEGLRKQFEANATSAEGSLKDFITQVGHTVNDHVDRNEKMLGENANAMIEESRKALEKMTAETQELVKHEVEKQLIAARTELDEYKLRRMKMIDERIIQMLEDVIKVALEKKLSLEEQSELVYRALEEAKRENAFK